MISSKSSDKVVFDERFLAWMPEYFLGCMVSDVYENRAALDFRL